MSRKRYVSTDISVDARVRQLAERSEFAALLYTWMIPHAGDDAHITADPDELLMQVVPGFRWRTAADVTEATDLMVEFGLLARADERFRFPGRAFYKYQAYVRTERRAKAEEPAAEEPAPAPRPAAAVGAGAQIHESSGMAPDSAQLHENLRFASHSSSHSSSPSHSSSHSSSTTTTTETPRPRGESAASRFSSEERVRVGAVANALATFGISEDPQLWRKVLDTYGPLDLEAEALKQADWLRRHRLKTISNARYLGWLEKALLAPHGRAAEHDSEFVVVEDDGSAYPRGPDPTWLSCAKCGQPSPRVSKERPVCAVCLLARERQLAKPKGA